MVPFHRIACAVDFSETSEEALRYAAMFAACGQAELHVIHATYFEPPAYFTHAQMDDLRRQAERHQAAAAEVLRAFASRVTGTETEQVHVVEGPVAEGVIGWTEDHGADLIVIGTHGRTGFNRLMLGSVAEKLMRMSSVPVLAVRKGTGAPSMRQILCPVNDTDISRNALRIAGNLAVCAGARLTVLHVREPGGTAPIPDICGWVAGERLAQCEVRDLTREGDAATEIIRVGREIGADLIVLGATHKRFFDTTVLGSTAVRVTRHAPAPVLVAFAKQPSD